MTTPSLIDEYTLASFIAGTLSEKDREAVMMCLLTNEDARECLHMACEALAAARQTEPPPAYEPFLPRVAVPSPAFRTDRPARRSVPHTRSYLI